MPRYEVYKDFGVEGRDNPTDRWDSKALKYLVDYNIKTLAEDTDPEYELKYIEIGDVNNIGEILNTTTYSFKNAPSRCRRVLSKDDVFISTVRTYLKAIGYIKEECEDFVCSTGFCVLSPKESLNPGYLYYSIIDEKFLNEVISKSTGVSYPAITPTQLVNIKINIPPLTEQTQIVEFLDSKTSLIDKLISVKQRKIELLKEKRTALINHVVTKGLNPNVKMKDSGIEWIGEIPEHWEVKKMKYAVFHSTEKALPPTDAIKISPENVESNTGKCLNYRSEYEGEGYSFTKGDLLLNKLRIYLKKILFAELDGFSMGEMLVLRCKSTLYNRYFYYLLFNQGLIDFLDAQSTGIKMPRVSPEIILNTRIIYPPKSEQTQIVKYLDKKTKKIDNLLTLEQKKIELLKEYRESLISEVVTGKIKVMKDAYSPQQAEQDA